MFPNHQAYSNMYYKRRVKPTKRRKFLTCRNDLKSTKTTISIPGLNRILDPSYSKLTKIIWIIIVVFCAIVCLTFTVKQIKKYFEFTIESNTIIHKKQKVQFPTFSICTVIEDKYFINMLKQEVKEKCNEYKRENCIENTKNILFSDLDISLLNIWQAFAIKNISVAIWGVSNSNNTTLDPDYNFESKHFSLGSCRIIKKTKPVSYFSVVTRLIVKMELSNLNQDLIFIPHGNLDFNIYEFEILSHEVEFLEVGGENQFKIKEEAFNFLNVTGRECYDDTKEGERIKQLVYNIITPDTCRLPFMPSKFPECLTLNNVTKSVKKRNSAIRELLRTDNRRRCKEFVYLISIDYVWPKYNKSEKSIVTELILKFADDTVVVISERFSYTFPDLASDLFAYWGFFLSLSALVFFEVIEILLFKLYSILNNLK